MTRNKITIYKVVKYVFLSLSAVGFIFVVKMCKSESYFRPSIDKVLNTSNDSSVFDMADELLEQKIIHEEQQIREIDSINNILNTNNKLSQKEIDRLKSLIVERENVVYEVQDNKLETVRNYSMRKAIVYDTIVENVIIQDTFYKIDTVYQIDTIFYNSEDVKSIKLKKQ